MQSFSMTHLLGTVLLVAMMSASLIGQAAGPGREPGVKDRPVDPELAALLEAHNRIRADAKLGPLRANSQLTEAARDHARDMAEHHNVSHEGSDGSDEAKRVKKRGYRYQLIGENIAGGQPTVEVVMQSWLNSPPHKENILANFTDFGAAVVPDGSGRKYWCAAFGRPEPEVDTTKSPEKLISALNRARTASRRPSVKADPKLTQVAGRFAHDLATRGKLDARNRDGQTPFDILKRQGYHARQFGLSLSTGESDPAKVVSTALEREDEREQLLGPYDRVGVAVAVDADGQPYWVVILAKVR
jgi:uncharacterized protein YkwD